MRTKKFTAKRVLGLTAAAALAVTGTVIAAGASSAASVPSLKIAPVSGGPAGNSTVITVTGKGLQTTSGTNKVASVWFMPGGSACSTTPAGTAVTVFTTISPSKLVLTTPALAGTDIKGTAYNLCVLSNDATAALLGTAKYTVFPAPRINNVSALSVQTGASYGGTEITIKGENFSSKTKATIGGKALTNVKVSIGSGRDATASNGDDELTGVIPAGVGEDLPVLVTNEGGSYASNAVTAGQHFTWLKALKISPAFGTGADNSVISISGQGFKSLSWGTGVGQSEIGLAIAGADFSGTVATAALHPCDTIQVESDTQLSCQINGAVTDDGAYQVVLVTRDAAAAANVGSVTALSRSVTYTVSDF